MADSLKAALLSGLIFPGIGHIVLKQYLRGWALVLTSLAALWVVVSMAYQRALPIADRILAGDIPLEAGALTDAIAESAGAGNGLVESSALAILAVCWLIGIVDSYRLGAAKDKQDK